MKVVVFEAEPRETSAFDTLKIASEVELVTEALDAENAARFADAEIVSTFVYSTLDRKVLEQLPSLKLIATRSTGYDHIDSAWCATHSITVCNVPHYGESTVAEHVFALLLALSHRMPEAIERARSGPFSPDGLQGFDLAGKTLGVVGTGNIGRHVIRIARGFQMDVLAYDVNPDQGAANSLGFAYIGLDELLARSDIITLHLPATDATHHLLSSDGFALMKPGAVVINTARGSLIDIEALIGALRSGKLAGAGLDVLPGEPLIREEAELVSSGFCAREDLRELVADYVLLRMPNVIVTPHSAFNTREAVGRIVQTTVENIQGFVSGRAQNVVVGSGLTFAK